MDERADVLLESECSDADLAAVAEVFADVGIPAEVAGAYVRRSAAELPWLVIIGVGAWATGTFLKAALQGAGDEAGRAGWRALMRLVKALYEARAGSRVSEGTVSIQAEEPRVEISLPPDLPDLAYQQLWETESPDAPLSGILMWDNETQAWINALARKLRCAYPGCQDAATEGRTRRLTESRTERRDFCDLHASAADSGDPQAWA